MLHFIIVLVTVFYLPDSHKHTKQIFFPSNQYHDITFLPQGLSNYSSFFSNFSRFTFQFFKSAESIFAQSPVRGHKYTLDQSLKVPQEKYGLYPHFGTIFLYWLLLLILLKGFYPRYHAQIGYMQASLRRFGRESPPPHTHLVKEGRQ